MKFKNRRIIYSLLSILVVTALSCKKEDSKKEYGFSKIYMPQAIIASGGTDNNYPVPAGVDSSTYNYIVDKANNKVHIILGAALSGPASGAFSVDISVNTDTIQKLLTNGTYNSATYLAMPAAMYTIPTKLNVAEGSNGGVFRLSLDIDQLKSTAYAGKFLLLAVNISNPTRYELNKSLSTTIVVLDVNSLVIGPRVDFVGAAYLKNSGNPFTASGLQSGQTRWGSLTDWKANTPALSHGGYGGFSSNLMDLECGWGSAQILNGKLYQTITLPAGNYYFDISGGSWAGGENFLKEPAYEIVAPNADTLPDYNNIVNNSSIVYMALAKTQPLLNFNLSATTKVTLGVVVNYVQTEQGFKTKQVFLYTYPKHL